MTGDAVEPGGVRLRVWAPSHARVDAEILDAGGRAVRVVRMEPRGGWFEAFLDGAGPGLTYRFRVDGSGLFPDPASRFQPLGVHGPSRVVGGAFPWTDSSWRGTSAEDAIFYEVHVGTATREGTFDVLIPHLAELKALGITVLELMPVADFPGEHNWGYDGVQPRAPARAYGGPEGLRRLVDAAHALEIGVILDFVASHLGPEGNYLGAFAREAFASRRTPWGEALDYSRREVRDFVAEAAESWVRDYHLDGLRLDATHAVGDDSETHILREIADRARAAAPGRRVLVVAEDERNDARLVAPAPEGFGLDAVWADDFHHQVRRALAGDRDGYYADFSGTSEDLARTMRDGWFFRGQWSRALGHPRGTPPEGLAPARFVHCIQNHDQIGNRAFGDRLGRSVDGAAYRTASALLLLSPYTPLLFMGQEWNATTPFLFFTDHEPELGRKVTEGRRREFARFAGFSSQEIPDPQAPRTFESSKLDRAEALRAPHAGVLALYRELIALRSHPAMRKRDRASFRVRALGPDAVELERCGAKTRLRLIACLRSGLEVDLGSHWRMVLFSEDERFGGRGRAAGGLQGGRLLLRGAGAAVLERDE